MSTDTSEKGLETLIMRHVTGTDGLPPVAPVGTGSAATTDVASRMMAPLGGTGYLAGNPKDFDRAHAVKGFRAT